MQQGRVRNGRGVYVGETAKDADDVLLLSLSLYLSISAHVRRPHPPLDRSITAVVSRAYSSL